VELLVGGDVDHCAGEAEIAPTRGNQSFQTNSNVNLSVHSGKTRRRLLRLLPNVTALPVETL
jgi:hypothetical protein